MWMYNNHKGSSMKYILFITMIAFLFIGCDREKIQELEKKNADLQEQVTNTSRDLSMQTQYVEEVTGSINAVYANMERISEGESMLSKSTKELEVHRGVLTSNTKERILSQINGIDTYIVENRKKLDDLESKLKSYRGKYQGLEKIVANLKQTLVEKEQSIASLEGKLNDMNVQVQSLEVRLADMTEVDRQKEEVINVQQKQINSAMYTVGEKDDLMEKGIIHREGGFPFGWFGKTSVLASGVNSTEFTTIDKYQNTTIEVPGKIDELVPKRKENYYQITESDSISKLVILDPEKFWQEKYLAVVMK